MSQYIWNSDKQFSVGDLFWKSDLRQFHGLVGSYKDVFVEQLDWKSSCVTNLSYYSILADNYPALYEVADLDEEDSDLLKEKVSELLHLGYLERSQSNWSSLAWPKYFADAPDELDICVDYSGLNERTDTFHTLPSIPAIHNSISQSSLFSKLVLKDAFHQIELDEESREMTAFETDFGTFQFTTFHRGMKNAAGALQHCMEEVLEEIDDIQIYQGQVPYEIAISKLALTRACLWPAGSFFWARRLAQRALESLRKKGPNQIIFDPEKQT